jgi:cytidylate kinase
MTSRILFFSGRVGSGKSTIATCVSERLSWRILSFGDFVRGVATERGENPLDRSILLAIGVELMSNGPENFCLDFVRFFDVSNKSNLVIEGLRHAALIPAFRRLGFSDWCRLVYLASSEKTRNGRIAKRRETLGLSEIDQHPIESDDDTLRTVANLYVPNDGSATINDLCTKIVDWTIAELRI